MEKVIKKIDTQPSKYTIIDSNKDGQVVYDIYFLTVTYSTGETQVIKAFTYPNTVDINDSEQKYALINTRRLSQLMKEQKREDYIFLGKLQKSATQEGYETDRFYLIDGISAQSKFDNEDYPKIKLQFDRLPNKSKAKENSRPDKSEGKHYVISDIHGYYGLYLEAIELLKPNDTLYILGDVIDRGKNGIKILKDIISRQNNSQPHIVFMMGNHEWQMIDILDIIRKYNLTPLEIHKYSLVGKIEHDQRKNGVPQRKNYTSEQVYQQILDGYYDSEQKKQQILQKMPKKLIGDEIEAIYVWLDANYGRATLSRYLQLPKQEQEEIYQFLINSLVMGKTKINDRKIFLVHAAPPNNQQYLELFEKYEELGIKGKDIGRLMLSAVTENRDIDKPCKLWRNAGYEIIAGHTPTRGKIKQDKNNNYTCIDAGCGHGGQLAMYCIEDGKAIYIEEKENEVQENNDVGVPR